MSKRYSSRQIRQSVQAKANPAYASLRYTELPQAVQMPKGYQSYAKQGYASDVTLYKCIRYICENGAAIPPRLYTDATMQKEITKHPILDKLNQPNNEQSGVEYREAVIGTYLISGNSYQYAIRKAMGPPDELWVLQPDKVQPMVAALRGVTSYLYDGIPQPIDPVNIGRMRSWNPNDPIFGMSAIEPGSILIDQQTAARKWNLALLQNSARPPGAWVVPTSLSRNDRELLETKINAKFNGALNAGKAPVLDAGMTWQSTSIAPTDMDWLESMRRNAGDIANLFNIPPQIIGDTSASTYNNMQEAKAASYTEAIFPVLDKLYALLNNWLLPMYPDLQKAYLYYDKTTVEVVQEAIQAKLDAASARAVASFTAGSCTLNQALVAQSLPEIGTDGDVYRVGLVLVAADKLAEYADKSVAPPPAPIIHLAPPAVPPAPDTPPSDPPSPPDEPLPPAKQTRRPRYRKDAGGGSFLVWHCIPGGGCPSCQLNEDVVVAAGDAFPNGATSPEDCHPNCQCSATEIDVPDEAINGDGDITLPDGSTISVDDLANGDLSEDDIANLIANFAVGFIASRRDRANAKPSAEDDPDAHDDELDDGYYDDAEYADPEPVKPKPKKPTTRKKQRAAYRAFMEATH